MENTGCTLFHRFDLTVQVFFVAKDNDKMSKYPFFLSLLSLSARFVVRVATLGQLFNFCEHPDIG